MNKDVETQQQVPSRRKLLKALTAGGAAAAVMPTEWTKPALKSVVLPAHAQTTGGGGGASPCGLQGWFWVSPGGSSSFSMSANVLVESPLCNGTGNVRVYNSSGALIANCSSQTGTEQPVASFSCSQSGDVNPAGEGDVVTFMAEFDGGCTCTFVTTVQ